MRAFGTPGRRGLKVFASNGRLAIWNVLRGTGDFDSSIDGAMQQCAKPGQTAKWLSRFGSAKSLSPLLHSTQRRLGSVCLAAGR